MSFAGAILILAIIVTRALAINKLPKKTFLALWGVALLRLLIPFSLPSMFSAYSAIERSTPAMQAVQRTLAAKIFPTAPNRMMTTIPSVSDAGTTGMTVSVWAVVWAAGAFACFMFFAISYIRCRREFQTSLPVENSFSTGWLAAHKTGRPITIRQSSGISAPLTYGVFRPVILMPKGTNWNDTKSLQYVLAHEYTHIRRFDALTKLILIAALCIHWFNPLVWAMYILANHDLELSCDEAVVRLFGEENKATYARTLISMEETKSGLTPLCNSFSKNAIEERVTAIMKIKKTSLIAICVAVALVAGLTVAFATSASSGAGPSDGHTFGDYERQELHAFQFQGYRDMTVADYQEKAWTLMDTGDYRQTLEHISQNNMFSKMADSGNEDAAFFFYTLEPLTAEKWQTRDFGGYSTTNYGASDNAVLEYNFTMTILDAKTLTVREYDNARLGIVNDAPTLLQGLSLEELQTDQTATLQPKIDSIAQKYSSDSLQISMQFTFMPLAGYAPDQPANDLTGTSSDEQEPRQNGYGTKEDYASLLALKTPDYQQMTVADFDAAVLDWANEHYDGSERMREDAARNDYQVTLTDEERSFVELTTMLSNEENFRMIQSLNTGHPEENPGVGGTQLWKETGEGGNSAWCSLYYQLPYQIIDKEKLTVGERDRAINGMINAIQAFWDEIPLDDMLKLTQNDVLGKMRSLADKYSNNLIRIKIDETQVHFECMDERGINFD
ncbi:M56 family metallopeptidase [Oscillibacter sp.]|uniref:M56 family metallopeptidase n=1 Tax=Oscillibacter sp. TaxID=1945593 RepID=UPI0028AA4DDC|nr:M56 family metallopeptidase [Oscillibacter sp.]